MKKILTLALLLTLVVSLAACTKEKKQTENNQIHVGLMKGLLSVPYYYALDRGIFEKYGLDVKLDLYNSANDRDAAFKGNHINGVSTDLVAALIYQHSGKDIVITSKTEEEFRLVGNKDLTISSVDQVNGAKIGVSENTVIEFLVDTVMKENGVTNYTKVPVPSVPDRFNQVKKGTIDMAIMPEPFPSLVMADQGKELWDNIDHDFYATCFVFERDFAEHNYLLIKKFNQAINEAIHDMMAGNYDDYYDVIVDNGLLQQGDLSVVNEQEFHPLSMPNEDTFNQVVTWAKAKGLINIDYKLGDFLFPYKLEQLNK